jgi:hypothetical protein
MQSKAATVDKYLAELPDERRKIVQAVRELMLENLDKQYEEGMQYGMIGYYVPHKVYPAGYHCDPRQPLPFAGLASQKNHLSLYLMCVYAGGEMSEWFQRAWAKTGKKLDMGKACVRFKKLDDLALDVIAQAVRRMPAKKYIAFYETATQDVRERKSPRAKKPAASASARSPSARPKKAANAARLARTAKAAKPTKKARKKA